MIWGEGKMMVVLDARKCLEERSEKYS